MKKIAVLFTLFLALAGMSAYATDPLYVQGTWSNKDYRSSNPANQVASLQSLPSVSVDNGIMFMSFLTDLSDLKVVVATSKGVIVYEGLVSGNSGLMLPVKLGLQTGSYILMMSHPGAGAMASKVVVN